MFATLTNTIKAAVAVAVSPAAVIADLATLPSTAYEGKPAFGKTSAVLSKAGDAMNAALRPTAPNGETR
ncbi:exported hypothetical protein [Cupriavidus phytorum]|uniref:Uncharacterized protein n=1 Tax=Cupriavidus taiwanensis TaxID=164546 RepID=A0A375C9F2_9BURK|nr:hypothetical protein [Cupriavidus taiwanensis]SOY65644.1 exported hypothetical protein [Cupriavidus taiwanensis]